MAGLSGKPAGPGCRQLPLGIGPAFLVAIPAAVKVFNRAATLYRGSISYDAPMRYRADLIDRGLMD